MVAPGIRYPVLRVFTLSRSHARFFRLARPKAQVAEDECLPRTGEAVEISHA